jgi:hypothetical protein
MLLTTSGFELRDYAFFRASAPILEPIGIALAVIVALMWFVPPVLQAFQLIIILGTINSALSILEKKDISWINVLNLIFSLAIILLYLIFR